MGNTDIRQHIKTSSNVEYYYYDGKKSLGPYSLEEFPLSQINKKTLVWKTGLSEWRTAESFSEFNLAPPPIKTIQPNKTITTQPLNNNNIPPRVNLTNCWFCGNERPQLYTIELNKYKKRIGEFGGGRKYSRYAKIHMCDKCANAFNKQQNIKTKVYRIIVLITTISFCIFTWLEPSSTAMPALELILGSCIMGFLVGIFLAKAITQLITNNPQNVNNKLLHSFEEHPDVIIAKREGYRID